MNSIFWTASRQALATFAAAAVLFSVGHLHGAVVGRAINAAGDLNLTTFNVDADGDAFPSQNRDGDAFNEGFTSLGDMFGLGRRGLISNQTPLSAGDPTVDDDAYPFAILDDSVTFPPVVEPPSTGDIVGIIKGGMNGAITDTDPFFGVVDTVNDDTGTTVTTSRIQVATWLFDVSGSSGALTVKTDMAAMGDFEGSDADLYNFEFALDGGSFSPLFTSSVDDPANLTQNYTLENPVTPVQTLTDPLFMGGTMLSNVFQTFSYEVGTATSTLTIRFSGKTDGGTEAFAFRNMLIEDGGSAGIPGDYNNDGKVDAADYVLWRKSLTTQTPLANDPLGLPIDQDQYNQWRANFGLPPGSGAALGSVAVPEPASLLLLPMGLAGLLRRRRVG